ncbi:L-type lectin-domain containing receptor kinase VIII.1, partial [Cucurbita argyrosperma subsp. argyrosperma]
MLNLSPISSVISFTILLFSFSSTAFFDFSTTAVSAAEFDFGTVALSSLKLLGDAHLNNGSVRLTRDLAVPNSGAGRVFYAKPIRFRQPGINYLASFSTFFSFSITNLNPSSIGGGLAFLISPDDDTLGGAGGFLGLADERGLGFVAVEFDTLMDVEFKDINGNHVGLDLNDMVSLQVKDLDGIGIDLKSGDTVNSWIEYDGSARIFKIFVSYSNLKPTEPLMSFNLDLDPYLNDFMYVGFSGSTQGSTEVHSVDWWSFTSSFDSNSPPGSVPPPPTTTLMNPTANVVRSTPPSQPPSGSDSNTQKNTNSPSCHNGLCKQGAGAVVGVVTAGAFVLALFAGGLIWVYSKKIKRVKKSDSLASEIIKTPKEFTYKELKIATKGFSSNRIIGHGAFGTVYKGILPETGDIVAVKRCSHSTQGKNEFLSELSIIGTLRHRNLVRLQGWCHEKGEILLVYDLMPNGSLDKALFEAIAAGTMGYLAPEYLLTGRATEKTDVFSFGAVVLEVASGRRPIEKETGAGKFGVNSNLVDWVWSLHREGRLLAAADGRLSGEFEESEMRKVLLVGLACSHPDPMTRPTMRGVVQMLIGDSEIPIVPRSKPSTSFSTAHLLLTLQDSVSDLNDMIAISTSSSDHSFKGEDSISLEDRTAGSPSIV